SLKNIFIHYPDRKLHITKLSENEIKYRFKKKEISILNVNIIKKEIKGKNTREEKDSWIIAKQLIEIPKRFVNKKELAQIKDEIKLPLYLAFNVISDGKKLNRVDYPIYIIFPTDTSFGLGCVLSCNFRPETSRKSFSTEGLDGELNLFLLRKASKLFEIILNFFKDEISSAPKSEKKSIFNSLLNVLFYHATHSPFESYIKESIFTEIVRFFEKNILSSDGSWTKASNVLIADSELWPFFDKHYKFIESHENENVLNLLKQAGIREFGLKDLVDRLINGKITNINELIKVWDYLSDHQRQLNKNLKNLLHNSEVLPNRNGKLMYPRLLVIPDEDGEGLFNSNEELHSIFLKNDKIKSFIQEFGVKRLKKREILEYFISLKSTLSIKNLNLIKKYYKFFHKFGLIDKKNRIILTTQGFKNPDEAFFNNKEEKDILNYKIPIIPDKIELSPRCKMYLENLGVSKEISAKYVLKHIKKYGSKVISLELLKFLSKNMRNLSARDLKGLENLNLIPTIDNKFVKPSECYLLSDENKKIFKNLVNYFDPKDDSNKDWLKFFKKIGIPKHPKIIHLRLALFQALESFKNNFNKDSEDKNKILERLELIFNSLDKNDEKEGKKQLIFELKNKNSIPTNLGLKKPFETYMNEKEVSDLLGKSIPYPIIKISDKLCRSLGINKKPIPQDVANYLLAVLKNQKSFVNNDLFPQAPNKILDKIYSYLGLSENFDSLNVKTKKKLMSQKIIYIPTLKKFEKASELIIFSKEAEIIYGKNKNLIKYVEYPNSLNFFRIIGVKTSINTDDITDFLIEYVSKGEIETKRLFMLYNMLGSRFRFISRIKIQNLKSSKIILAKDLESFETPNKIFIPDETSYVEKFPEIKTTVFNDKIIQFLEKIGVKKISEVVNKNVLFSGEPYEDNYSRTILAKIKELIPYIEAISKDGAITLDKDWKRRINRVQCKICDNIYYELSYKNKKNRIHGRTVEYDSKNQIIGIKKGANLDNSLNLLYDLSKSISSLLFRKSISSAKLTSPLIEKLLFSENKISTLKDLGFSTYKLEARELKIPQLKLKISETTNQHQKQSRTMKLHRGELIPNNISTVSTKQQNQSRNRDSINYNIIKKNYGSDNQIIKVNSMNSLSTNQKDYMNIIIKTPPSQNEFINYINTRMKKRNEYKQGNLSKTYKINNTTKRVLNKQKKILYKNLEFAGTAVYGGLDITPPIPKLNLQNENGFEYYIQEKKTYRIEIEELKRFKTVLQYIVKLMEGKPETVSVAVFEAPIEAFNYNGQLIFNYLLMADYKLEKDLPLYLIWIFIAAHELAHNFSKNHDQIHSKYLMIFAIRSIQYLLDIEHKFIELFN
ncbi:MAG: hypothetical protein ACFFAO_03495, partial [Candidatus Hermodarchaeota archaeon]